MIDDQELSSYDYYLPADRIAQVAVDPRNTAKLLVYNRCTNEVTHKHIYDLPSILHKGDVLVLNDTKVFKARVHATVQGRKHEVLLIPPVDCGTYHSIYWKAICTKTRKLKLGDVMTFSPDLRADIVGIDSISGEVSLAFNRHANEVFTFTETQGEVPLPPYIVQKEVDLETYQTTFAQQRGSVAAPTAGRHFTPELFQQLTDKGVEVLFITLHVGIGTFMPVRADIIEEHVMHAEWVSISSHVARSIHHAKRQGRRVVAVGTTTTRALEGAAFDTGEIPQDGFADYVNIFIHPGFTFRIVDSIMTNFHLPKSTLLMLMSAMVGRERLLSLYEEAINKKYRFYSLGDAMFVE